MEDDLRRVIDALAGDLPASEVFRLIAESIGAPIAVLKADWSVETLNRAALEYFGLTLAELKNWQMIGVVHPDDLPGVIEAVTRSSTTGFPYDIEHRCLRADGAWRWFQVRAIALRDREGAILRWYTLLIDIDDRKRSEGALRRAHYHLTEGQRLSLTGSFTADPAVDEHTWSDEFYRICDLEPGSEATIQKLRDLVHPDDVQLYDTVISRGLAGHDFDFVFRIVTSKGALKHLRGIGRVVEQTAGRPVFVGAIQDVTEGKLAEAALMAREVELRRAYGLLSEGQRLSQTGSFVTDLLAEEHNWSDELYRMFGFDPATKLTVQVIRDLVQPEDLPAFDEGIAASGKGADFDLVFRIRTPGGVLKHVRAVARVIEQIAGRPLFVGAIQDVTESKLREDALNKARADLAHVSRIATLGTLTASIAHEVNNPLSGIVTNAGASLRMLAADPPDLEGARETARRTIRDANRASEVVSRLRALFANKASVTEPVDLNQVIREVIALSRSELQRSGVILRLELAEELPPVTGDRIQLQQVVLNLLLNAAEAMSDVDDRPRQLVIRTERNGDDRVGVTVDDAGVGLPLQDVSKLFQSFYTTKETGMGIGLSVSRSIVERHGGELWATPKDDSPGARFSFSIPTALTGPRPVTS
jgi:PAS domain S-box-containing protein